MNPWNCDNYTNTISHGNSVRKGISLKFQKDVNRQIKKSITKFIKWIKNNFNFQIRLTIYVYSTDRICAMDGEMVVGTFWEPDDYYTEPYIRIATGDYKDLISEIGTDNARASILCTIAHEITHYYQWINQIDLTIEERENQAEYYSEYIIDLYSNFTNHP